MLNASSKPIPVVIRQHAEDAAVLRNVRSVLAGAPHVNLMHLRRLDTRLAAHLDGLAVASETGWAMCAEALAAPGVGSTFVAAVRAIDSRDPGKLEAIIALAETLPEARRGLLSAFGWLEPRHLRGVVSTLLCSDHAFSRFLAVSACGLHRVDPGLVALRLIEAPEASVRARALRMTGELQLIETEASVAAATADPDPECSYWGAWSAVLLGDRGAALEALTRTGQAHGPQCARVFCLSLQAMPTSAAHGILLAFAREAKNLRWLIQGSGIAGDPAYVSWLIAQMAQSGTARLAGEAFTLITGTDLAQLDLERKPPDDFESGPNDDPDDPNVEMDPDEGLPWPDVPKVEQWWAKNAARFQKGQRYFMGAPVTRAHCIDVLKHGYQRQRILAAHYLCLLEPGTPLFNTSAPAWRQQRLLAQMT